MKPCSLYVLAILYGFNSFAQSTNYPDFTFPCGDFPYVMIWNDEFDNSIIDQDKWHIYQCWEANELTTEKDFVYQPNNVWQSNGYLYILTQKHSPPLSVPLWYENLSQHVNYQFPFSSGQINSYQKNLWLYGKFEARIKIAGGYGMFPAFWLYTPDPYWSEIDVFEFFPDVKKATNKPKTSCKHLDFNDKWPGKVLSTNVRVDWRDQDGDISNDDSFLNSGYNPYYDEDYSVSEKYNHSMADAFHIYTLEWDPYKLVWKVDDNTIRTFYHFQYQGGMSYTGCDIGIISTCYKRGLFAQFPMELFFNTAIGQARLQNNFNCLSPDNAPHGSPLPVYMIIDYIRIFKKTYCNNDIYISEKIYKPTETEYLQARNIDVAGNNYNVLLQPSSNVKYLASESIHLHPGFKANEGSYFRASIVPCESNKSEKIEENEDSNCKIETQKYDNICENSVFLYPNPNDGCFIIESTEQIFYLSIVDIQGKEIAFSQQGDYICCNTPGGQYFAVVRTENFEHTLSFTIYPK